MKEVVFDYGEFCSKVDRAKPVHHMAVLKPLDRYGVIHECRFMLSGVSRDGHVLVFEAVHRFDGVGQERNAKAKEIYSQLAEKYAKPLGSTEGRWE